MAHELALSVLFESGLQHMADDYRMYEKQSDYVIDFLKIILATWDESLLLDGYPGRNVVMARRNGNRWFVAGIVSQKEPTGYLLKFPFLSAEPEELVLIVDDGDGDTFRKENHQVNKDSEIHIKILPEGGFSGVIQ